MRASWLVNTTKQNPPRSCRLSHGLSMDEDQFIDTVDDDLEAFLNQVEANSSQSAKKKKKFVGYSAWDGASRYYCYKVVCIVSVARFYVHYNITLHLTSTTQNGRSPVVKKRCFAHLSNITHESYAKQQ